MEKVFSLQALTAFSLPHFKVQISAWVMTQANILGMEQQSFSHIQVLPSPSGSNVKNSFKKLLGHTRVLGGTFPFFYPSVAPFLF